jgi:hypothetical protein
MFMKRKQLSEEIGRASLPRRTAKPLKIYQLEKWPRGEGEKGGKLA